MHRDRRLIEDIKVRCLAEGVRVDDAVLGFIRRLGQETLTVHEYATTAGLTLRLAGDVWLNAPFDEWYCANASVELIEQAGTLILRSPAGELPIETFVPLPAYSVTEAPRDRAWAEVAMSHGDRIRVSPINGCAYDCTFCDLPADRYRRRDADVVTAALDAADDPLLPARHVLISGGSPGAGAAHRAYFEDACRRVVEAAQARATPLPVDIMMSPWPDDPGFVDRMDGAGVHGWSINMEIYGDEPALLHIGRKHRFARPGLEAFIARAVQATGGAGRVRSLLVVGLESLESTLEGVTWLAERGCDPVLSPFRPARRTALAEHDPVDRGLLVEVLAGAREITQRYGVALGPRCLPCQHNTLTFPWDVPALAITH